MKDEFEHWLSRKRTGGVPLDVFVSREIWLGGVREAKSHDPFVAVGPSSWEGEEELTFFSNPGEVEDFVARLREAARAAFGNEP